MTGDVVTEVADAMITELHREFAAEEAYLRAVFDCLWQSDNIQ
jgi:hypothetical protein